MNNNDQTRSARKARRVRDLRENKRIKEQIAEIVKDITGCQKCAKQQWCKKNKTCLSNTELARTLETYGITTSRGRTKWRHNQVASVLQSKTDGVSMIDDNDSPLGPFFA